MPLKINLKKGQKVIINGAVIENLSTRPISFMLMNKASILRDTEILSPEEAVTPASRVYYALQCMFLFPEKPDKHFENYTQLLHDYEMAAPSCAETAQNIRSNVEKGELYRAIKYARELISHETMVLNNVHESASQKLRHDPGAGEPDAD